jgi:L-alanine-DL-glutamate epimerase-like enolase superfamily enzyme
MITATLHHLRIPLKRPFGHVIATRDHAEAIVLLIETDGASGVGECVPRPYVTGETFESVWNAILKLDLSFVWARVDGTSRASLARSVERLALPTYMRSDVLGLAAGCAVELAVLDLRCKLAGWTLGDLAFEMGLPAEMLSGAPLNEVISVPLDMRTQPRELAHLVGSKLGHLKVKVGADLETDVRRVRECRRIFGSSISMSVDANMAWSVEDAVRAAEALRPFEIAWYEEPLQQGQRHRYRELRELAGIPVMLDEAACSFRQTRAAIDAGACDLINIRISKCGGYLASLRLAELARSCGVRFQHGSQVGQLGFLNAAGRQFTSIVRGIVACEGGPGLANLRDFPTLAKVELDWDVGHLVGVSGPGIGASPDPAKLRAYSIRSATWTGSTWHPLAGSATTSPAALGHHR